MDHVVSYAAAVSEVNPDNSLSEPAIYMIQIPAPDGNLSGDDAVAQINGNQWVAVGDRIVVAEVVQEVNKGPRLRPLRIEDRVYTNYPPILLKRNMFDPHHPDYAEFHKCISSEKERIIWKFADHAREGRDGFLLQRDGRLTPYSHIYDHMTYVRDSGHGHNVPFDGAMGVNPLDTIGPLPSYDPDSYSYDSDSEEELQMEQDKSATRARGAGKKVKRKAVVKISPYRKGRLPWPTCKKATVTTIAKRAARTLLRKPVSSCMSSYKKTTTTRPAAASTSAPTSSRNKPPVATPSPRKPFFGVATSAKLSPAPRQTSPVRLTRSTTRQGLMALPSITPPLPERRLPAYIHPASQDSQPVAGPSSLRMEDVPKTEAVDSQRGYILRPRGPLRSG